MSGAGAGKKLREAARQLAGGGSNINEAMDAFGICGELPAAVEIWEECRPAIDLFIACATQWRRAGMDGAVVGLDYLAVEGVARMVATPITPQLFWDLRILEDETLTILAERRA